jgi:hypothetical protein
MVSDEVTAGLLQKQRGSNDDVIRGGMLRAPWCRNGEILHEKIVIDNAKFTTSRQINGSMQVEHSTEDKFFFRHTLWRRATLV